MRGFRSSVSGFECREGLAGIEAWGLGARLAMPAASRIAKKARRNHHFRNTIRHVPQKVRHETALSIAGALFKLGTDKDIAKFLGPPATPGAVRAWRRGKRRTPVWVADRLTEARAVSASDWEKLDHHLAAIREAK